MECIKILCDFITHKFHSFIFNNKLFLKKQYIIIKINFFQNSEYKEEKKKFRSYEELKIEMKDLKMNITTDAELLGGFFDRFTRHKNDIIKGNLNSSKMEEILDVLNNLEFLIHQIDNAQLFADLGG